MESAKRRQQPARGKGAALSLLAALLLLSGGLAAAETQWLGPDGEPLRFSSHDEVVRFLRSAKVVDTKTITGGINQPLRLTLEQNGTRARAIFRDVDVTRRSNSSPAERHFPSFRDSYVYEVAAYEMSLLLGLDCVPPATLYEWNGQEGSLQLWVEGATSESERLAEARPPADTAGWHRQRINMFLFDNLIHNFDRNHGNQLLDETGKLWLIDHTRSFKRMASLPSKEKIVSVDSRLWERLQALDPDEVKARLKPYLTNIELGALLKRRQLLIKHVRDLIAERGELQVLIDNEVDADSAVHASPQWR